MINANVTINQIYDYVEQNVNRMYRPVRCSSVIEPVRSEFPACEIVEINHYQAPNVMPLDFGEHGTTSLRVDFEVHVFSNHGNTALTEARSIMDDVEYAFRQLYFTETSCLRSDNADATVVHLVARFTRLICDGDVLFV